MSKTTVFYTILADSRQKKKFKKYLIIYSQSRKHYCELKRQFPPPAVTCGNLAIYMLNISNEENTKFMLTEILISILN